MGAFEQARLVQFMDNGGSVFMEGANVGSDHQGTDFFDHFGADFISGGYQNAISTLSGVDGTFTEDADFGYPTDDPNYNIDQLAAGDGVEIIRSQENSGRTVKYDSGSWRTIISSPILGAFDQSDLFSTRKYLMMEYICFLSGIEGPELFTDTDNITFNSTLPGEEIQASLYVQNVGYMDLEIWDIIPEGDEFLLNTASPLTLSPMEWTEISISFRADAPGIFAGYLELITNDRDHQNEVITLEANCLIPPDIEASILSYDTDLMQNESEDFSIELFNYGGSDLNYEITLLSEWLNAAQQNGTIPDSSSQMIEFTIDTTDMMPDEYADNIILTSNDPDESPFIIPVTLTVLPPSDKDCNTLLQVTELNSVYPNPFNPEINITFSTAKVYGFSESACNTELNIYNIRGQKIVSLINDILPSGNHSVTWNGIDDTGKKVGSGIYFVRLRSGNVIENRRIILMK